MIGVRWWLGAACAIWIGLAGAAPREVPTSIVLPHTDFLPLVSAEAWDAPAPAAVREFLARAAEADRIDDPMKRCLAFPDTPGNRWPPQLAQALCQYQHGPHVTLDQVKAMLDRGDAAGLDALFKADLERHFSTAEFSEVIHRDFDAFDGSAEAGKVSLAWLEKAPHSAYALTARGQYFTALAGAARGDRFASETSSAQFQRMRDYAALAVAKFREALAVEPRMMPAYDGMAWVSLMGGRESDLAWAFEQGNQQDPACRWLRGEQMSSLSPRWGGSAAALRALAASLEPMTQRRVMLTLVTSYPWVDAADEGPDGEEPDGPGRLRAEAIARTPLSEPLVAAGRLMSSRPTGENRWWALVYYLEATRFVSACGCSAQAIGDLILSLTDQPQWAMHYLTLAMTNEPTRPIDPLLMVRAYVGVKQFDRANKVIGDLLAKADRPKALAARHVMVAALMDGGEDARALPLVDQMLRDNPHDAIAMLMRIHLRARAHANLGDQMQALEALDAIPNENRERRLMDEYDKALEYAIQLRSTLGPRTFSP